MARSDAPNRSLKAPSPSRQLAFHQLLVAARKLWLADALAEALGVVDPAAVKREVLTYAATDALKLLAAAGIRDELIFPTPIVLAAKPTLVGYYRLLLGASQKSFYAGATGMTALKSMELKGSLTKRQIALLPEFCRTMGEALADLVRQISPAVTPRDVVELRLLTLGSQFQGSNNVKIGQQATSDVFLAIVELLERFIIERADNSLVVKNASGRRVFVALASDPDIQIAEEFKGQKRKKVAIEIKGGTDKSNAHNRAGEAEKSHQKARNDGFMDFWTIIAKKGLDVAKLKKESPTSRLWFDVAQVLGRTGDDWDDFRSRFAEAIGVPLK
jgi:hypothetical protein